jgi:hypothetical protein
MGLGWFAESREAHHNAEAFFAERKAAPTAMLQSAS